MIINGTPCYNGMIDIPTGKSGRVSIAHRLLDAGHVLNTCSIRTQCFGGHSTPPVSYDHATRWHSVEEKGRGVWMTDLPIEQVQHDAMLYERHVRGDVLVGGLGVGYAAQLLARRTRVRSVTVVERSKDIIRLVWEPTVRASRGRLKLHIVHQDLFKFLRTTNRTFDYGFFDIWQSDDEATFHDIVMPLRRLSREKVQHLDCWNEDIMRGHLVQSLSICLMLLKHADGLSAPTATKPDLEFLCTKNKSIFVDWAVPFWQWFRNNQTLSLQELPAAINAYVDGYARGDLQGALASL